MPRPALTRLAMVTEEGWILVHNIFVQRATLAVHPFESIASDRAKSTETSSEVP
jgi:hypothetical protein